VSWAKPTSNSDGTVLTDISGYRVIYGTSASNLSQSVNVAGASNTSASISSLALGTYYVAVMTLNAAGVASNASGVVAFTIK
jgi:hypothetical protein